MIVSHKHKFIFVKTAKTAGTSVEIFLSSICGPDDIVTPVKAADEELRRSFGGITPRNCDMPTGATAYNHMPIKELYSGFPEVDFSDYLSFTVERNPAERLVSLYYWDYKGKVPSCTIDEYIDRPGKIEILKERGWGLYTIEDKVVVDRILNFDDLVVGLQGVLEELGLSMKVNLPRAKGGMRKDRRPANEILSATSLAKIRDRFACEIALMGFTV